MEILCKNYIIESLVACRRYRSNFLLNVGPMGDASLRAIDKGMLEIVGVWVNLNKKALLSAVPVNIEIKDKPKEFNLQDGNTYYLFVHDLEIDNPIQTFKSLCGVVSLKRHILK